MAESPGQGFQPPQRHVPAKRGGVSQPYGGGVGPQLGGSGGGAIGGTTPGSGGGGGATSRGPVAPQDHQSADLLRRIDALEKSGRDIDIWVQILIAAGSLILLANIGLSIWQVRSIAEHEVETAVANFEKDFQGVLSEDKNQIAEIVKKHHDQLAEIRTRISALQSEIESASEKLDQKINGFRMEVEQRMSRFIKEMEEFRATWEQDVEAYHDRQVAKIRDRLQ